MPEERQGGRLMRAVRRLLPPRRSRLVPYSGLEVLAVFFLAAALWPALGFLIVTETGLGSAIYGPETVAEVVRRVRPYAVDVASGVESRPGEKDHARLQDFIRRAKAA